MNSVRQAGANAAQGRRDALQRAAEALGEAKIAWGGMVASDGETRALLYGAGHHVSVLPTIPVQRAMNDFAALLRSAASAVANAQQELSRAEQQQSAVAAAGPSGQAAGGAGIAAGGAAVAEGPVTAELLRCVASPVSLFCRRRSFAPEPLFLSLADGQLCLKLYAGACSLSFRDGKLPSKRPWSRLIRS